MTAYVPPADAPGWFLDNLRQPGESHFAPGGAGRVHHLRWNWENDSLPVLLLVHGFGGHVHWWSYLAPFFSDRYRVLAADLPGMGDSSAPAVYADTSFADGLLDLLRHYDLHDVTIAGHSFGGLQSMRAMTMEPARFRQGIVVDSLVCLPPEEPPPVLEPRGHHKHYGSLEECMGRFRLVPEQPAGDPALLQFVAFHSCRLGERGWHWKFDARVCNRGELKDFDALRGIQARVDCIYGEHSLFNQDRQPERLSEYFSHPGEVIHVPGAHHHLMIDHPLALVDGMNRVLLARA
ncbi:alpha/beta hydrolase [Mangrovimicrobium sediminis]|uniref:Alpha/beta hydrolase n=1 Tax=Mangrovimicrobium sediminis TaxID=2562682 RepID=A0A4Z0LYY8_9GAMM|nr:alpha/beta hydrolase [Haliea sp. SAOS-164]TGD72572.1 alpha/beta hydrolase [Haliea sp. SAOS-164]